MVERAFQIAEACIEDMSEYNRFLRKDFQACEIRMHPKDILENIFYFRVCSFTEQIALINYLDKFISEHKDVGIVVICRVLSFFVEAIYVLGLVWLRLLLITCLNK